MLTNFPNGLSSFGVPLGGSLPFTYGRYIFVNPTTGKDGNDGLSADSPKKTVQAAYDAAIDNNDDVIVLSRYAAHALTKMLDVSKNRVHFVGDLSGRVYGLRARVTMGITTATADVFAVKNTGVGNTFTGIKFDSSNTLTQHVATVGEGGEYAIYSNCELYASGKQASDTHAELLLNGDSAQFVNCTLGSLALGVTGDKVRPAVLLTRETITGKVCRDCLFNNCRFWKNAGGTTTAMVKSAGATDVERVLEFHDCQFIANPLGSAPAVAIACAATLTDGMIILTGDTCATKCTKIATAVGVFNCTPARVATATIGIQAT